MFTVASNKGIDITDGTVNVKCIASTLLGGSAAYGATSAHPTVILSNNSTAISCDTSQNVTVAAGNLIVTDGVVDFNNTSTTTTVTVDSDGDGIALAIDTEGTTANCIDIQAPTTTTGNIIDCGDADSLTTGSIARFASNSSDTGIRELLEVVQDHASATAAIGVRIQQDSSAEAVKIEKGTTDGGFFNFSATADADATSAISTNTTSGGTTHHVQVEINGTKAWIAVSTTNPS